MANEDIRILIVDDDENNRFCAMHNLKRFLGYPNAAEADDGDTALQYLEEHPDTDIILMDRMMNKLNGIQTLHKMNEHPVYKHITVIFQTGEVSKDDKQECINSGSLYLLQKPYSDTDMAVLLSTIVPRIRAGREMRKKITAGKAGGEAMFTLKTLAEAEDTAALLALHFPDPAAVCDAIYELLMNAIEHGNLDMGHANKKNLLKAGTYAEELTKRQTLPENAKKVVTATVQREGNNITLTIKDQGKGFSKENFIFGPDKLRDPNGRGLFKAEKVFGKLEYKNNGSEIICQWNKK